MRNVLLLCLGFLFFNITDTSAQKRSSKAKEEDKKGKNELSYENRLKLDTYFFEGIREKNAGNQEAAIANFSNATKIDPNHHASYYELGQVFLTQNKFLLAEASFATAVSIEPKNEWYLQTYAKTLELSQKFKEAEEVYLLINKYFPEKINYYFDLAAVKIYQDKFKEALKTYDLIEKKTGVNEEVAIRKQKIWLKLGDINKATDEIKKLIKSQPLEVNYRMMLAEIYLANSLLDKALPALNDVLLIDPNNGFAQLALADYYRQIKDDKQSYEMLKKAFGNSSINIDQKVMILSPYFNALGVEQIRKQALELSQLLTIAHSSEAKAFAIYGDFLYQDKQLDAARASYEKTVALDKKVFAVWQNLLFIQAEQNDYPALLKTSNEALELYPTQQVVHYMNAFAKAQTKDYQGAITSYQNALNLLVNNKELEAQIYAGLGDAYHSLENHENSDASYDQALNLRPDDPYVLNNYAYYLSVRNVRLEKALEMSKKSNELVKDNSSFQDTYAWILFKLKKYDDALVWIEYALKNGGEKSATLADHKGDILYKMNEVNKAVEEWKRAKALGEQSEVLDKKIAERKLNEQ